MSKILFISNHYFPKVGGIEQNIHKISTYMTNDHQTEIIAPSKINPRLVKSDGKLRVSGLKILQFFSYKYDAYDVILITNFSIMPHFLVYLRLLTMKNRPKIILIPHGGLTLDWKQFPVLSRVIKYVYNVLIGIRLINSRTDSVISVSNWEAGELKNIGIKIPISVIRNGIDTVDRNTLRDKENYFVYLGRIDPIKNIEGCLRLFSKLRNNKYGSYKLKIIGDGSTNQAYYDELVDYTKKLKIEKYVDFVGKKIGSEKLDLLQKSQALICLSNWESDPIVIKEAFSVGTKVILNDKFGLGDFKNELNAFTLTESSSVDKIKDFLDKPFVHQFAHKLLTWEEVYRKYEAVYK